MRERVVDRPDEDRLRWGLQADLVRIAHPGPFVLSEGLSITRPVRVVAEGLDECPHLLAPYVWVGASRVEIEGLWLEQSEQTHNTDTIHVGGGARGVVVRRCLVTGGSDENASVATGPEPTEQPADDVLFDRCIFAEPGGIGPAGVPQAYNVLVRDSGGVTFLHCLSDSGHHRNFRAGVGGPTRILGCVSSNSSGAGISFADRKGDGRQVVVEVVRNLCLPGPLTPKDKPAISFEPPRGAGYVAYVEGNLDYDGNLIRELWWNGERALGRVPLLAAPLERGDGLSLRLPPAPTCFSITMLEAGPRHAKTREIKARVLFGRPADPLAL